MNDINWMGGKPRFDWWAIVRNTIAILAVIALPTIIIVGIISPQTIVSAVFHAIDWMGV